MADGREIGRRLIDAFRGHVARSIAPLITRVKEIEDQLKLFYKGTTAAEKGERGERGEKGDPGREGKDGALGPAGKDGRDGRDGKDGEKGDPGRDALAIDILPAIDEARSYPRGTYARHLNGLWWSAANTSGMRGWECIVTGIQKVLIEQIQERKFKFTMLHSDGDPYVEEFSLPVAIYRGIFKPDTEYLRGDEVTWGGSKWHCVAERTKEHPKAEGCKDWVLSVKRGDPGKSGAPLPPSGPVRIR